MPNFVNSIQKSIKKLQDDSRKKKADRYGVSLPDYDKGVKDAKAKGNKIAYNKFLKDVEKKQYLIQPSKAKKTKSTLESINSILDSFEPKKKQMVPKPGSYTLAGGKIKRKKTNKNKRRKQKSKSKRQQTDFFGVNF